MPEGYIVRSYRTLDTPGIVSISIIIFCTNCRQHLKCSYKYFMQNSLYNMEMNVICECTNELRSWFRNGSSWNAGRVHGNNQWSFNFSHLKLFCPTTNTHILLLPCCLQAEAYKDSTHSSYWTFYPCAQPHNILLMCTTSQSISFQFFLHCMVRSSCLTCSDIKTLMMTDRQTQFLKQSCNRTIWQSCQWRELQWVSHRQSITVRTATDCTKLKILVF